MEVNYGTYIEHHGVKGMHWGIRQSKGKTGVGRLTGALLDRNQRSNEKFKRRLNRKGTLTDRTASLGANLIGHDFAKQYYKTRLSAVKQQKNRLEAGKPIAADFIQAYYTVPLSDLFISRTAGHAGRLNTRFG